MSSPDGYGNDLSSLQNKLRSVMENLSYLEERLPASIVQGYIRELQKRIDSLLANAKLDKEQVEVDGDRLE